MTPRERWLALLDSKPVDRIPTDYQATGEVTARLLRDLDCANEGQLWRKLHIDSRKYVESKWKLSHHPDDPEAEDRYLLERVTVGYLTSTYELAEASPSGGLEGAALLVGAPDFGTGERGPVVVTPTGPCPMPPFDFLPGTVAELEEVSELLQDPKVLQGAEVTKPRLARELGRKPWLIHFATHAYFAGSGCVTRPAACGTWTSTGR